MGLRRNILIFHLGALGDFVVTWPLALALARLHPQSRVFYVTHGQKAALAERALRVESLDIDGGGWHRLFSDSPELLAPAAKALAGAHTVLNFVSAPDDSFARNIAALNPQAELLTVSTVAPADFPGHQAQFLADQLPRGSAVEAAAQQILRSIAQRGIAAPPTTHGPLVIHPGGGAPAKCWPAEHFIALATRARAAGLEVRILVGEVELERWPRPVLDELSKSGQMHQPATLVELMGHIAPAGAFVGNDSGPGHLAGILGVPTLCLFGNASSPQRWKPLGPRVSILHAPLETLTVDRVWEAVCDLLKTSARDIPAAPPGDSADDE